MGLRVEIWALRRSKGVVLQAHEKEEPAGKSKLYLQSSRDLKVRKGNSASRTLTAFYACARVHIDITCKSH